MNHGSIFTVSVNIFFKNNYSRNTGNANNMEPLSQKGREPLL